jgi:hypothetical protein
MSFQKFQSNFNYSFFTLIFFSKKNYSFLLPFVLSGEKKIPHCHLSDGNILKCESWPAVNIFETVTETCWYNKLFP